LEFLKCRPNVFNRLTSSSATFNIFDIALPSVARTDRYSSTVDLLPGVEHNQQLMAIGPKQDQADVPVMVGRRSTRLSVAVPITISGEDAAGNDFRENTFTLNVNKHGAEIATSRALGTNAVITIENGTLGRKARARVVQRRERRTPNSPYEVSVELLDPENIWGVRFPPTDWEKDSPSKALSQPSIAESQPQAAVPVTNDSKNHEVEPTPPPAAASEPAEATSEPPQPAKEPEARPVEETAVETAAPKLAVQGEPETKPLVGALAADVQPQTTETPATSEMPAALAVPETTSLDEKIEKARTSEARLEELVSRLEASSAQLESLLSNAGEARRSLQSEMDRVRSDIQQAGLQAAHSAVEEFRGKLNSEWEAASAPMLEDSRRRLQEDVSTAVAAFGKEAGTHLARLTQESGPALEAKQKQAVNLAKEQIAHAAEAAVGDLSGKLGKSAEEISASLRSEMKASFDKTIADSASRLAQSLHEQAATLLQGEASPIHKLRGQMEEEGAAAGARFKAACGQETEQAASSIKVETMKAVTALSSAAADANAGLWESSKAIKHDLTFKGEKVRNHLAEISSASEEGFKNYTQVLVKGAQEEARENLRVLAAQSAQDFSAQLQKLADGLLESFGPQLQHQAEDAADLCKGSLESISREAIAETQIHVAGLSLEAQAAFSNEVQSLGEQLHGHLRSALQDFLAAGTQEMQNHLRKVSEEEQRTTLSRIQTEGKAAGDRVVAEIQARTLQIKAESERAIAETKDRTEAAARQASDVVYKQIGVATVVLKDWGDQAAARLETQFKESIATFERQVQELANRSLEANRLQAEATTQETRRRLEQATRILRGDPTGSEQKNPSTGEPGSSSS
jgi:hypothetical protein